MNKKKLKIAVFHLGFFFSGGGEKLVLEEAGELMKRGWDVSLFAPVVDKEDCFPDIIKRFKVHSLFFPFSFNFPLRDFISIAGAVFLTPLTFFRYIKYDVFFGANQPGPLICFLLSKILKKPYVIYLAQPTRLLYPRKIDLEKGFGKGSFDIFFFLTHLFRPIVLFLDRVSIQKADKVLINGEYMAGIIQKVYGVKGVVCPAGCYFKEEPAFYKERWNGELKIDNEVIKKPYILVTNRHFPQKRLDYAIKSLVRVRRKYKGISLVITGASTVYTQELKTLVKKLGLEEEVLFTGLVSEKNLSKLYSQAVIYLYTSPEEDFGMGIIEAMAAGVPVVAWDNAGPSTTVINNKTGFLVKPCLLGEFAKKIVFLLQQRDINIKMGKNGIKRVKENYTYKKHSDILEEVLLQAGG